MDQPFQLGEVAALVVERPLGEDRPAVERGVDPVDRHAEDLDAVLQCLLDGMGAAKRREQRRVNVDNPS